MKATETAELMKIVAKAENRVFDAEDGKVWHLIIGHLDYDKAHGALVKHLRQDTWGRTRPGQIVAIADRDAANADIRMAWANGSA